MRAPYWRERPGFLVITALGYTVRLDNTTVSGTNALKVNINAGIDSEYSHPADEVLAAQSTLLLVFNTDGTLRARHVYGLSDGYDSPEVSNY
jgi:hypothetical protein